MSGTGAGRLRTAVLLVSATALVGAMFVAVRRDGRAREVIAATDSLRDEVQEARDALNAARRRADSLGSRRRILDVAGRMGFRAPADTAVRLLPRVRRDTTEADTEGSGR